MQRSSLLLGKLGELFRFSCNTTTQLNTETESHGKVEINRGLRYVEVICDIAHWSRVIDPHCKRRSVISTLPLTNDLSQKCPVVYCNNIDSRVHAYQ